MSIFNDSEYLSEINSYGSTKQETNVISFDDSRKPVVPQSVYNAGVQQDSNSTRLYFETTRLTNDGVDLSTKLLEVKFFNPGEELYVVAPEMKANADTITFSVLIPYSATKYQGQLYISVRYYSIDQFGLYVNYSWQTIPFSLRVYKGLPEYVPTDQESTILQQVLDKMNTFNPSIEQAREFALEAKSSASDSATSASQANTYKNQTQALKDQVNAIVAGNEAYTKKESDNLYVNKTIRESQEGSYIDAPTTESVIDLTILGNARQVKLEGKNLFNVENIVNSGSSSSNSQIINERGKLTFIRRNGSAPSVLTNEIPLKMKSGVTYTVGFDIVSKTGFTGNIWLQVTFPDGSHEYYGLGNGTQKVTPKKDITSVALYVNNTGSGETANGTYVIDNIQFEKGGKRTSYEPYCYNTPSPNMIVPQVIESVGGICTWDKVIEQGTILGGNNATSSEVVRTATFIEVQGGQTYRISATGAKFVAVYEFASKRDVFSKFDDWTNLPFTFTPAANTKFLRLIIENGNVSLTPSQVSVSICPVLHVIKSSKNLFDFGGIINNAEHSYSGNNTVRIFSWFSPAGTIQLKPNTRYRVKYKITMVEQMSDPTSVQYTANFLVLTTSNITLTTVIPYTDIIKSLKAGESYESDNFFSTSSISTCQYSFYSGILNYDQAKNKPTIDIQFVIMLDNEDLPLDYPYYGTEVVDIPLMDIGGNPRTIDLDKLILC